MELKGKTLSLASKLFAGAFAVIGFVVMTIFLKEKLTMEHIKGLLSVAAFISVLFAPVDVSFWLEKIVAIFDCIFGKKTVTTGEATGQAAEEGK